MLTKKMVMIIVPGVWIILLIGILIHKWDVENTGTGLLLRAVGNSELVYNDYLISYGQPFWMHFPDIDDIPILGNCVRDDKTIYMYLERAEKYWNAIQFSDSPSDIPGIISFKTTVNNLSYDHDSRQDICTFNHPFESYELPNDREGRINVKDKQLEVVIKVDRYHNAKMIDLFIDGKSVKDL